ncbi:MAG: prepilin-type N-terminal cleavage/methylation domain-containing protein [Kangiellaceae bacterium]|nr:prepilin-type N-terminal cleavage/methylation domain-containing protein [Kangiellaceae bacterium]
MNKSLPKASGFTLIELIVVIVILGIMAAIAGPKFVDLQSDARLSVVQGVEGSIRSAATLVYSKSLIDGTEGLATSTVAIGTGNVDTVFGYPAATGAGMDAALDLSGDITASGAGVYTLQASCLVTYTAATAIAAPGIVVTNTGC